ncbi:hypothetical protein SHKM778_82730 [Streptomyces sp. KM77-8]|uniref:Transporter n=1 Tax=Streptomyces haneummycinicus TaxID=3074435 RepID=A0AAT9HWZ1_9ACTN
MFTNTVFGLILVYTYLALWDERPGLGGYDQAQAVTYVWLGQCLYATLAIQGGGAEKELMERIRTGEVAVDLYRPVDLQLWWLAGDVGRAAFQLLGRGVVPFLFGSLFFTMALPAGAAAWVAFAVTLVLAAVVSFAIRYLAALCVFWLMDGMGIGQVLMITGVFFSGMVLPLNVFPGTLGEVVRVLPWAAQIQVPADVLMGSGSRWGRSRSRRRGRWPCWRRAGCFSRWRRAGWWCRVAERGVLVEGLRAYGLIAAMWVRSGMTYRTSFVFTVIGNLLMTGLDFVGILLMFTQVDSLGGWSLPEIAMLYGLSVTSFGIADMLLGSMDVLGARMRDGSFDVLLVRPVPVLAQVGADRFAVRRLGRIAQGTVVLGWALSSVDVEWTAAKVLLVPVMVLSGAAIFSAVFVAGAAFQIYAQDAAEVQNAFTYGGTTLLQYPPTVFGKDLVRGATFMLPLAFVNWVPAAHILDRPYPIGLPGWAAFASPLVAVGCCALAGLAWRTGLRSYRSTGS